MAYRNTIISIASVVALGTACSKAPSYNADVQTQTAAGAAAGGSDAIVDVPNHGPQPQDAVTKPADKTETASTTPAAPPAPPAQTAAAPSDNMVKITNKAMFAVADVTTAQGWGTSAAARIKVPVAVDAAGAVLLPKDAAGANIARQLVAKVDAATPNQIALTTTAGAAVVPSTLGSYMVVCNKTAVDIYLHSGTGGAPFAHGTGAIKPATCAAFSAQNLLANTGASYDHIAGQAAINNIFLQPVKIGPDGKEIP